MKPIKIVATKKSTQNDQKTISKLWGKYPNLGRQAMASTGSMLITLTAGMTFSFTGTLLPSIDEYVKREYGAWLASAIVMCMPLGGLASPFLSCRLGKKKCLMLGNVLSFLGWLTLSAASHLYVFLIGCAIVGFSSGFTSNVSIPYLIEIPERRLRGSVAALNSTFQMLGIFVGHLLGLLLPWRTAMRACSIVPMLSLCFIMLSPESPSWLLVQGRYEEAKRNFFWVRGVNQETEEEFDLLLSRHMLDVGHKRRGVCHNLVSRKFLVPFFILAIMFGVQMGSGADVVTMFIVEMLQDLSPGLDVKTTILFDIVAVMFCMLSSFLMRKVSRRPLFFCSAAATILALLGLATVVTFELSAKWVIVCMCTYTAALNTGIIPVTWLSLGEIYPEVTRDVGVTLTVMYYSFMTLILVNTVPLLIKSVSILAAIYLFAGSVLVFSCILYFIMPETKQCTLEQVEDEICKKKLFQKKPNPIN